MDYNDNILYNIFPLLSIIIHGTPVLVDLILEPHLTVIQLAEKNHLRRITTTPKWIQMTHCHFPPLEKNN